jgi:hypothetical protein
MSNEKIPRANYDMGRDPNEVDIFKGSNMTEKIEQKISLKEQARQAYRDQQSQDSEGGCGEPVGFICGYLDGYRKALEEMDTKIKCAMIGGYDLGVSKNKVDQVRLDACIVKSGKSMTNEEMEKRWPEIPPFDVNVITLHNLFTVKHIEVNQDTIDDIISYFKAARECMQ